MRSQNLGLSRHWVNNLKMSGKNLLGDMSFTEYNCPLFQENPSSQSWMMCTYLSLALTPKRNIGLLANLYIDIPCVNNFPQSLPTSKLNFLHFFCFLKTCDNGDIFAIWLALLAPVVNLSLDPEGRL